MTANISWWSVRHNNTITRWVKKVETTDYILEMKPVVISDPLSNLVKLLDQSSLEPSKLERVTAYLYRTTIAQKQIERPWTVLLKQDEMSSFWMMTSSKSTEYSTDQMKFGSVIWIFGLQLSQVISR